MNRKLGNDPVSGEKTKQNVSVSKSISTIFIFKSSYSNYKTNLFRSFRHSSVVTAGSRDIDNDKLHN